jgi:hypothetical protein
LAAFKGLTGFRLGQIVQAVGAAAAFDMSSEQKFSDKDLVTGLANSDTVVYRAHSSDDPTKWEVGLGTYVSASKTVTRTTILASSNANAAVDFTKSNGGGANVVFQGISGFSPSKWTLTNVGATRTFDGTQGTAATISAALALLIQDLTQAGVISAN